MGEGAAYHRQGMAWTSLPQVKVSLGDHVKHQHSNPHPHRPQADMSQFYVITIINNAWRYKRRYELYWRFKEMCEAAGVKLITVECTFGHRPFMVTEKDNPMHLQLRTIEELWHKENMVNLGVKHACAIAPGKVKEVAWVDADCFPMIPAVDWFEETWHALQHYEFVQMWSSLLNFGPNNEMIGIPQPSFMKSYEGFGYNAPDGSYRGKQASDYTDEKGNPTLGRPGLAWAANIDAFNKVGGLIDFCILGSGDWHMAHALVGAMTAQTMLVGTMTGHGSQEFAIPNYRHALLTWQEKCERWIKRDVGHVEVTVGHSWHGKYKDRKYGSRGKILVENEFNPYTDIKPDAQGLLQLETWEPRQIRLRDQIRHYFKTRAEDSIDT